MRLLFWILFVALTTLLSTNEAIPVILKLDKSKILDAIADSKVVPRAQEAQHSVSQRLLCSDDKNDANNIGDNSVDEERVMALSGVTNFFTKIKHSVGKLNQKWQNDKNLRKMNDMFTNGMTPEKLEVLYGATKKVKLQEDFKQFYKWRSSWQHQKPYPLPKKVNP